MKLWCFTKVIKVLFCIILAGVVLGTVTMFLWNWLIPAIFNGPQIKFIEAIGILVLAKILFGFGGWKGRHGHCNCQTRQEGGPKGYWKKKWEEKFSKLSPEEKEKFKHSFKRCWGGDYEEPQQTGQ